MASLGLRQIFGEFGYWMANSRPPWADYRALMSGRLIGLDKYPGLRPVGVGDTWWRILEKYVLLVTGEEAKEDCVKEQLFSGLEAGNEGGGGGGGGPRGAASVATTHPGGGLGVPPHRRTQCIQ